MWSNTKRSHRFLLLRKPKTAKPSAQHPPALRASPSARLSWEMIHLHLQRILLVTAADPPWDDRAKLAQNQSHYFFFFLPLKIHNFRIGISELKLRTIWLLTEIFSLNLFSADNIKAAAHRFIGEIYEPVRKATETGGKRINSKSQDKTHVSGGF